MTMARMLKSNPWGRSRAAPGGVSIEGVTAVTFVAAILFAGVLLWEEISLPWRSQRLPAATSQPATAPAPQPVKAEIEYWMEALDYAWLRETRCGRDPFPAVGEFGEEGEYQIRPIFIEDVERLYGYTIDPHNNASCRWGVYLWWKYYAPRVGVGYRQKLELYRLYNLGPTGYMERSAT